MKKIKQDATKAKPNVRVQRKNKPSRQGQHPQTILQRAQQQPESLSSDDVLQLQRSIGNQATLKVLQKNTNTSNAVVQRGPKWNSFKSKFTFDNLFGVTRQKKASSTPSEEALPRDYAIRRRKEKQQARTFSFQFNNQVPSKSINRLNKVDETLENPLAYAIFKDHLDKEFGHENYIFIDFLGTKSMARREVAKPGQDLDSERFETVKTRMRSITNKEAVYLYNMFIDPTNAPFMINISSRNRNNLKNALNNLNNEMDLFGNRDVMQERPIDYSLLKLFNMAEKEILKLMNDSFLRFQSTRKFRLAELSVVYEEKLKSKAEDWGVGTDNSMLKDSMVPRRKLFW